MHRDRAAPAVDPRRLERVHVVGVRIDRAGQFVVRCSDGIDMTWSEWCAWGCADLRRALAGPGPGEGGSDGDG